MKTRLYLGTAALALVAGVAHAQDLMVEVGEGAFNWDSYNEFAEGNDFSGQALSITGPWTQWVSL